MKQAQLTIMIILGLILLMLVAVLLYLAASKASKRSEEEVSSQKFRQAALRPVKDYIESCLDLSVTQGIELLGKQGGVIYESQGGITPNPTSLGEDHLIYDSNQVNYLVKAPTGNVGYFISQPDEYPWRTFPYKDESDTTTMYFYGFYGVSKLPPLYKEFFYQDIQKTEVFEDSIQEQLEVFVAKNTANCVDWSNFEMHGLDFSPGITNVTMLIAENSTQITTEEHISFTLHWPIEITDKTTGAITNLEDFSITYQIRFASLYYAVKSIIDRDVTNITFDVRNAKDFVVSINHTAFEKDSLVNVTDPLSTLKGRKLEFRFARQNRPPALFWIDDDQIDDGYCKGTKFVIEPSNTLLINEPGSSPVRIQLNSSDPDENLIQYIVTPAEVESAGRFTLRIATFDGEFQDGQDFPLNGVECGG